MVKIMLVSVAERTKEIGLRKALGATHRNILTQFFVEGAFLTLLSGGVGLAITAGFFALLAQLPPMGGFDTPRIVPFSAGVAVVLLGLCGVGAGGFPARPTGALEPVGALR